MKYIFLDIDGVLTHMRDYKLSDKHPLQALSSPCVESLKGIIKETGAVVVVTSTWRKFFGNIEEMNRDIFSHYSLETYIIDATPVLGGIRGDEISAYMREHGISKEDIVILDDDSDMDCLLDRLVRTSFKDGGLTTEKANEAILKLRS